MKANKIKQITHLNIELSLEDADKLVELVEKVEDLERGEEIIGADLIMFARQLKKTIKESE